MAAMTLDLFAGIPVRDYATALVLYERLLGHPPTFFPNDTEAVWELAEHRYAYILQLPERTGHALHTVFVTTSISASHRSLTVDSNPRNRRSIPTACAKPFTSIPTVTRSASAVVQ
jgi:hypothetical protein